MVENGYKSTTNIVDTLNVVMRLKYMYSYWLSQFYNT